MSRQCLRRRCSGVALVVALILLVVLTLLGLSSVRTVALEERMTANTYDRSLAFQAAEAALRAGEAVALAQANGIPLNSGFPNGGNYSDADPDECPANYANSCSNGLCQNPDPNCTERWLEGDAWQASGVVGLGPLAPSTAYIVEYLGSGHSCVDGGAHDAKDCKRYRVTARSTGAGRATVLLQSIFATE